MCVATEPSAQLQELRSTLAEHAVEIEAREFMQMTWHSLNARCFGGSLKSEPVFILSDFDEPPHAMGQFIAGDDGRHMILIHRAFFFEGGTVPKQSRMIIAGLVLLHEMIHQRRHEIGCRDKNCHGPGFVRDANRLSKIMGLADAHISIEGDCQTRYWPFDVEPGLGEVTGIILEEYKKSGGRSV
jgi:hypothetical protein